MAENDAEDIFHHEIAKENNEYSNSKSIVLRGQTKYICWILLLLDKAKFCECI